MQIPSTSAGVGPGPAIRLDAGQGASKHPGGIPFSQLFTHLLQEVDQPQQVVTQDMNNLLTGQVDNIHDVAINAAKADIAFRMVMEVRDKLITAYQDVMRMQI